ncbi:lysylphosphatidylglycerol synthase transmembrane domain-containing protein [Rhodococcus tibetensis]|uniref:YbhN family protein n=1 Tax=Rhodococcus tibetensis TaxID=2965064 RepID=A0ABT1Q6P6_9NOCA|nr:YbhN family protein [Rhodococcus sp. FXJ9.536]MCQ4117918.1 YbhN family protein [Rhodococcus sp. FXJ9.536]
MEAYDRRRGHPHNAARASDRVGVGALLVVVLTVEAVLIWPDLSESVRNLGDLHWEWVAAAVVASLASMSSFARVQRCLLGVADVHIRQSQSLSVTFAANSLSVTLPGGPVLATTFTYRQTRIWGATPVVATWQLVMAGVLQAIGLAVVGLAGALLVGAETNPFSLVFTFGGLCVFLVVAQYAASRPDALEGVGITALRAVNSLRKNPAVTGVRQWKHIVDQMGAVRMERRDTARAFGWSLFNWVADASCLGFACYAIGGQPALAGLAVAYAAGNAAGSAIPLLPAGLGVMDAVLVPALTASGMTGAEAVSAIVVYRLVSFLLMAAIGWVVFALRFRGAQQNDEGPDIPPLWGKA